MRITRAVLAATTATLTTLALLATPAHADVAPPQPFYADSMNAFDSCPHGATKGSLLWVTPGPLAPISVEVTGEVVDRPDANSAVPTCTLDDYASTATFTAYSGTRPVASTSVSVDNGTRQFQFTLGGNSSTSFTTLTSVTVQVCRSPIHTLPPSYCGKPVTYTD